MKKAYADMTSAELQAEKETLEKRYNEFKAKGLKLDMSRGKPGSDQLDLSKDINDVKDYTENGVDLRNYGMMDGTPEWQKAFCRSDAGKAGKCDYRSERKSDAYV